MGEAMIRGRRTRINYAKDWQYTTNDTATLVTKYIGTKTSVIVPNKIEGKPVVLQNSVVDSSGSGAYNGVFAGNQNIKSVKFEEGVSFANNNMHYAFHECLNLISAPVIPTNVTDLSYAFACCANLASTPNIPSKVTNMQSAFSRCLSITDAPAIPASVTIMTWAFSGCQNLVNAPDMSNAKNVTNMYRTFQNCTNLKNAPVIPANVTDMVDTFYNCYNLVNAPVIPANVTRMGGTFSGCINLINAPVIPANVTNVASTFYNCTNLVNAPVIPANVTSMYSTFCYCRNLKNAPVIPNSVTNMGYTFAYCYNLTGNIYIKSNRINNTSMQNCFYGTTLPKNVYIPSQGYNAIANTWNAAFNTTYGINGKNGVTVMDDAALDWTYTTNDTATLLTKYTGTKADVTVPTTLAAKPTMLSTAVFEGTNVNSVDLGGVNFANLDMANAFNGCTNLKSVKNTSVYINQANDAFHGCTNLTGVYAQNVTGGYEGSLGEIHNAVNMFRNCHNMTRVPDFDSLATDSTNKANYSHMFDNCYSLQSYTIGSVFSHYFLKPDTVDMSYMYANCRSLEWSNSMGLALYGNTNASHAFDNTGFKYLGQMTDPNYEESTSKLSLTYTNLNASYMFANCKNMVVADFEASGTGSANFTNAFYNCQNLTDVKNIPNGISSANFMFANCKKLVNISPMQNGLLGTHDMCQNCVSLKNAVEIPDTVTSMWGIYRNCSNLVNVPLTAISLNATDMDSAFYGCTNLVTAPIIPPNITDLRNAFNGCTNLTGNVAIYTNKLTSYASVFNNTTKAKNVYIYNTNTASNMWNVWNNTTSGVNGKNGVTLINMGTWENACWQHVVNGTNTAVVNYKGSLTDVYVPKTINGKNVVIDHVRSSSTVNVFKGKTSIKRVKIENGVSFMNNRMNDAFSGCYNLVYVSGIPSAVTEAGYAFSMCNHLVNAPVIPANVINMHYAFYACTNLINAPVIPANVTIMYGTFFGCSNLINAPSIPSKVVNLVNAFQYCTKLKTAPTIPASVGNMAETFCGCTNLTGNIRVQTNSLSNYAMQNCFYGTTKTKNVYIPFTGYNSVANTHNAAINSAYGINGKNGVTIYDINTYKG